jgi:hypothetical protein
MKRIVYWDDLDSFETQQNVSTRGNSILGHGKGTGRHLDFFLTVQFVIRAAIAIGISEWFKRSLNHSNSLVDWVCNASNKNDCLELDAQCFHARTEMWAKTCLVTIKITDSSLSPTYLIFVTTKTDIRTQKGKLASINRISVDIICLESSPGIHRGIPEDVQHLQNLYASSAGHCCGTLHNLEWDHSW